MNRVIIAATHLNYSQIMGDYDARVTRSRPVHRTVVLTELHSCNNTVQYTITSSTDAKAQDPSVPMVETYFCMFSSAVPSQLVPSIWQAFHDGEAHVAARISAITLSFSSTRVRSPAASPSGAAVGCSCGCVLTLLPCASSTSSRLKEFVAWLKTPSEVIHFCQGAS